MTDKYLDFNSGENVTDKIICVTPTSEKRHLERRPQPRRSEDRIAHTKAAKFGQLLADLRFRYDFWWKLYQQNPSGYYEGRVTAYSEILRFYAEPEQLKAVNDREGCERIAEERP